MGQSSQLLLLLLAQQSAVGTLGAQSLGRSIRVLNRGARIPPDHPDTVNGFGRPDEEGSALNNRASCSVSYAFNAIMRATILRYGIVAGVFHRFTS